MLSSEQIKSVLESKGFEVTKETKKKIELTCKEINQYVYINKASGNSASSLILDPIQNFKKNQYIVISGVVNTENWYHSSNMGKFPKRINNGESPISFGIPFGFETEAGLKQFVEILNNTNTDDDPLLDIKSAEKDLKSLSITERDAVIKARIGQGPFRDNLISYWGACAVTGLSISELLIASHSKPWRSSNNQERLDVYNGLLLSPNLDKAFDKGFITFGADKKIIFSSTLKKKEADSIGIYNDMGLKRLEKQHLPYLKWHNENIFKK